MAAQALAPEAGRLPEREPRLWDACRRRRRCELPPRARAAGGRGGAGSQPTARVAPPGACRAGGSARRCARSDAAGASRGAAGDRDAVLRFAPAAAAHASGMAPTARRRPSTPERCGSPRASRRSASRSAGAAVARVLSHRRLLGRDRGARGRPICHRELGDDLGEAGALTALANVLWCPGRIAEALESAERAVSLLQRRPPGRALVSACAVLATPTRMPRMQTRRASGRFARSRSPTESATAS